MGFSTCLTAQGLIQMWHMLIINLNNIYEQINRGTEQEYTKANINHLYEEARGFAKGKNKYNS